MKERPILFTAPMVRAILEGRKTQTRRIIKNVLPNNRIRLRDKRVCHVLAADPFCPYGISGDRLWVRETHEAYYLTRGEKSYSAGVKYRADDEKRLIQIDALTYQKLNSTDSKGWTPSIHMYRWASRIDLEITGLRVDRLQDISEADAIAEGALSVRTLEFDAKHFTEWKYQWDEAIKKGEKPPIGPSPKQTYAALWNEINGKGSWDANPWVWVIEFKKI
jgi:hypothetical protein